MTIPTPSSSLQTHDCGGTILMGGSTETAHLYCDRCGAYTYDIEAERLPTGTDEEANRAAWDDGDDASPDAKLDLSDLPRAERVEIYEDNAGGLWFRPVGQGLVISMPETGDALSDCRLYGDGWEASDSPEDVFPEADVLSHGPRHIATYRPDRDTLDLECEAHQIGTAGRRYLDVDELDA